MNLRRIWQRVGIRRRRLAVLLLGFAIAVVALEIARVILPHCDAQEKAALTEFPQYGGRMAGKDLEIYGDELNWPPLQEPPPGCTLEEFAASQASPKQVIEYYEKKLTEHGWTVKVRQYPADGEGPADYSVVSNRDGLRYDVDSFDEPAQIRVNVFSP